MPKVTVGITAFNASSYVETCLNSIVSQTMPHGEIEVIIVDDGSLDNTVARAEAYRNKYPWAGFTILTQQNSGGPATGRNRILDIAAGEFLFFVDVDDYLGPEALTSMWGIAGEGPADLVLGKFVGVDRGVPKYIFRETKFKTDIRETSLMDSMNVLKMFRTSYARGLGVRFDPALAVAEDHPFALAAYANTDRIAIQGDTDCYFAVRHKSESATQQHLTGQQRTAEDFFAYMHASFSVLATATARKSEIVDSARGAYWNRLLTLDIPSRLIRTKADGQELSEARKVVSYYGAHAHMEALSSRAKAMLHGLLNDDKKMLLGVSILVRG